MTAYNLILAREIVLPIVEIWAIKPRRFKLEYAGEIIADLNGVLGLLNWHNLENDYETHENFVRAAMMLADIHFWQKEYSRARFYHRLLLSYYNVQISGDGWDPFMEVTRIEQLLKIADISDLLGDYEEAALALKTARVEFKKHRYDGGFDEKYCGLKEARFISLLMKYHDAKEFCDFSNPIWKYDEFVGSKNFKCAQNPMRKKPEFAKYPHPSPDANHPLLGLAQQKDTQWYAYLKADIDARIANSVQIWGEVDGFLGQIAKKPFLDEYSNKYLILVHLVRGVINIDNGNFEQARKDLRNAASYCCVLIGKYDDFMVMYNYRAVFMLLYKISIHFNQNIEAEIAIDYFTMMDNQVGYRDWHGILLVNTRLDETIKNPETSPYKAPKFKIPLHWGKAWPFDR